MVKLRKISRGYQITLPQTFREHHNLQIGDFIEVIEEKDQVLLRAFRMEARENPVDKMMKLLRAASKNDKDLNPGEESAFLSQYKKVNKKTA
jgi:bifunctional DNA-binding transcriptional regulator/antitoxin component of YhaV-PrlF toxin-antitoxin module